MLGVRLIFTITSRLGARVKVRVRLRVKGGSNPRERRWKSREDRLTLVSRWRGLLSWVRRGRRVCMAVESDERRLCRKLRVSESALPGAPAAACRVTSQRRSLQPTSICGCQSSSLDA